jgi:hypothetical protein
VRMAPLVDWNIFRPLLETAAGISVEELDIYDVLIVSFFDYCNGSQGPARHLKLCNLVDPAGSSLIRSLRSI